MYYQNSIKLSVNKTPMDIRFYKYLILSLLVSFIYIYSTYFMNVLSITVFNWRPKYACFYRQIAVIPQTLQRLIAYYFYILRLHISFRDSVAELSKKCIYFFIISVTIGSISVTFFVLISTYLMNMNNSNFICGESTLRYISFSTLIFQDTLWSAIFLYIYIKKLIQITKLFDVEDPRITIIVKKLSVLASTSIISTYLLFAVFILCYKFAYQLTSIDLLINNVCIMLSFKTLDNWYNKLCCCYNKCCIKSNVSTKLSNHVKSFESAEQP